VYYRRLLNSYSAQRVFRQVKPRIVGGVLDECGPFSPEAPVAGIFGPTLTGDLRQRPDSLVIDLLGEGDMRMVNERFIKKEPMSVHGSVHGKQLRRALAYREVNHVRNRKYLYFSKFDSERGPALDKRPSLIRGPRPVAPDRPGRQDADMRPRFVTGHDLAPEIVQKNAQGRGNVDDQGVDVEALLGRRRGGAVFGKSHSYISYPFCQFLHAPAGCGIMRCPRPPTAPATLIHMTSPAQTNPLTSVRFPVPFDKVRADDVEPAVDTLLAEARNDVEAIAASPNARTFDNTMVALDLSTERLDYAMSVIRHLEAVATYPELRTAYNAVDPKVAEFYSSIPLHEGLWKALKVYAKTADAVALTGGRRRFLDKTIASFRCHGAELDPQGKKRLQEIDIELSRLTTKYSENVLDSTNAFELVLTDEADVAGLPPTALAAARESAARKSREGWRFTLQAPDYFALLTYLDNAQIRRQMYEAYAVRATYGNWDNRPIVARILELRREKATLLGFPDFADFVLEDRMAHKGAHALEFLEDLKAKTERRFEEETWELTEFRRSIEGPEAADLAPWDVGYYAEKQRAKLYDFDEEALRPYFPLERVTAGLFELVNRLYGIQVREKSGAPVWDPAVRYYEMFDEAGALLGGFYADWYPRENKRGGAWADALITGGPRPQGFYTHLGLICGNLTPPVGGKPALLTHREVETIFHEFGHLLHHLLSRAEIRSQAGSNVAWDFVELPSQIMENWCWEREALDLFARHYETGAPVPDDLFQKMKRARTFRAATAQMRQLGFGFVDLLLHVRYSPERDGDVVEYSRRILDQFSPARLPAYHAMIAAFTHLFGGAVGYAAGYYSYKWAEVLDADAFTRFRDRGIFSREVGGAFRECILSKGDSEDPAELYRAFMGRDPDPQALLVRSGLA